MTGRRLATLLPDLIRLLRRLAADKSLPRGVRMWLAGLMVYLALPLDLIPDFIPVLGYADDAIVVAFVLRHVVRRAGLDAVRAHWPGTEDGFATLVRLTGIGHEAAAHSDQSRRERNVRGEPAAENRLARPPHHIGHGLSRRA